MENHKVKDLMLLGCGFRFASMITDEDDIIKGFGLFLLKKEILTFAYADSDWVDEDKNPYKFKLDGTVLFVKRIAIGIGLTK